jgi:hypothetical protein
MTARICSKPYAKDDRRDFERRCVNSRLTDVIEASHFGARCSSRDDAFGNLAPFHRVELLAAPADPAFGALIMF